MPTANDFVNLTYRYDWNNTNGRMDWEHKMAILEDIYRTVGAMGYQKEIPDLCTNPVDFIWRDYVLRVMPRPPRDERSPSYPRHRKRMAKRLFVICPECAKPYSIGHFFMHARIHPTKES